MGIVINESDLKVSEFTYYVPIIYLFILKYFIYLFLERGREGEREGEKHQCVVASRAPPTGFLAHNPGTCPDGELNQQLFGSQVCAQSTEPHQPGHNNLFTSL